MVKINTGFKTWKQVQNLSKAIFIDMIRSSSDSDSDSDPCAYKLLWSKNMIWLTIILFTIHFEFY